jgi:hypothetical protein
MDIRDTYSKCNRGPGGFSCSCCRIGSKKQSKVINARGKRRAARLACKRAGMDGADFASVMVNH